MNKLFREENAQKVCRTCIYFQNADENGTGECTKRANMTVSADDVCRKYSYNIFSKQVLRKKPLKKDAFKAEDFSLD